MRKGHLLFFVVLWFAGTTRAQLCQGSLGDPIVNISFGSGPNPGPPFSGAATSYQYTSGDCPNDGYYTLRSATSSCFSSSWHSVGSDHTGGGYFMLVNASYEPGTFYLDTVDVFCSNTTYEFAAWVMNVLRGGGCSNQIQPNLSFNIEKTDGSILQTYNTGDVPIQSSPAWKQYGFFFKTPPGVSKIVLRIINNAPGGCGNDLALDDITFRPCGPLLKASIEGNGVLKEYCEGEAQPQNFSCEVSPGYANPHFQWQQRVNDGPWTDIPGANEVTLHRDFSSTTPAAEYRYRLSVSQIENLGVSACRVASNELTVRVHANPLKTVPAQVPVCEGSAITFSATGGTRYNWTGPNGFTATTPAVHLENAQFSQSGNYYLEVRNAAGCERKDTVEVMIHPRPLAAVNPDTAFICEGASVRLTATGGTAYAWQPSAGLSSSSVPDPLASPRDSTRYMAIVSNSFGCADTGYVQVNLSRKPVADAGPDRYILQGQSAQLAAAAGGTNISYSWTPPLFMNDPSLLQPVVSPLASQNYSLQVSSANGCGVAADSVKVYVFNGIYVPNAFSPNDDGLNDHWNIPALKAYPYYEVRVFNRWGQLVYHSTGSGLPWNGTLNGKALPTGVYPYVIELKDIPATLTGWVMLVR